MSDYKTEIEMREGKGGYLQKDGDKYVIPDVVKREDAPGCTVEMGYTQAKSINCDHLLEGRRKQDNRGNVEARPAIPSAILCSWNTGLFWEEQMRVHRCRRNKR